jgi:hypothetical protein
MLKLKKSLYGLKQSGRNWNNMLHEYFVNENVVQSLADTCVYTKISEQSKVVMIVWVDDIIVSASTVELLESLKHSLCCKLKLKDPGRLSWFLGIEFKCQDHCIKYVEKILNKFQMNDCKSNATPCELGPNKVRDDEAQDLENLNMYREIVGSLIYVMTGTRPDLCYIVTKLSQHMAKPKEVHLNMAKHTLRYLKGTLDYGLKSLKLH